MFKSKKTIRDESVEQISLENCFAKTCFSDEKKQMGKTVDEHCRIVGEIADYLLKNFCSEPVQKLFPENTPLIAALHDIGKISPTFQIKLFKNVYPDSWKDLYPSLVKYDIVSDQDLGGHPTASYVSLKKLNEKVSLIAAQHHGAISPKAKFKEETNEGFGGQSWAKARSEEIQKLEEYFKQDLTSSLNDTQIAILSGLTCISDWIGSGSDFDNNKNHIAEDIGRAVENAGFRRYPLVQGLSFEDIFGFTPTTLQQSFFSNVKSRGVYVIEAPMGIGKTEIALYAAYKLLSLNINSGIYFALPTQLTSNKIFERMSDFLKRIISDSPSAQSFLLHSNASLIAASIGADAKPGNSWFSSAKRGLLYPFAVGTLDQALMAVMNVKHSFVRAFGLAGKVVIIDEVHSYDCYTGTILDRLIEQLLALKCTVIILSATLNEKRRSELLKQESSSSDYPIMTFRNETNCYETEEVIPPQLPDKNVSVCFRSENECIKEAIIRAKSGQQVLWIENTVTDAQNIYKALLDDANEYGIECGLLHSKFTAVDRDSKEQYWVTLLGKNSTRETRSEKGRILIGTQVLEQSLDIDADYLISRFAPTDMLLQRIGRLWRHSNTLRPEESRNEVWIIDSDLEETIKAKGECLGLTSYIYNPYVLCRSLEVWKDLFGESENKTLSIPHDIRELINRTYEERKENDFFQDMLYELKQGYKNHKGTDELISLARSSLSEFSAVQDDEYASTRYIAEDTVRIILIKDISKSDKGYDLVFPDNTKCTLEKNADTNRMSVRETAIKLQQHMVSVSESKSPVRLTVGDCLKYGLNRYLYIGSYENKTRQTDFALMKMTDKQLINVIPKNENYVYRYSYETGLEVYKKR